MIRCYYAAETIDTVAKAGRRRVIGCGCLLYTWPALVLVGITIRDPTLWFRFPSALLLWGGTSFYCGIIYLFHWLILNVEKTTLQHAGDEITLDDNEIRLVRADGTHILFPREGLKCSYSYHATGNRIFKIWNSQMSSSPKIILTSHIENAKELVETIQPGIWEIYD